MTDVPINIVISSKDADAGGQKVIRTLDSIKEKSNETKKATSDVGNSFTDMGSKASSASNQINKASSAMGGIKAAASAAKTAVIGLTAAISAKAFLDAAREMQNLEARLKAITGSSAAAGQAMNYLKSTSAQYGVDLQSISEGFARLLPSVKSGILTFREMDQLLKLSTDNIKAFGLNVGQTDALFLGLSQTFGSGTVTLEDLRQVTDQLPGSFNAIAKAMGVSVGQLKEMISQGNFTADMLKGPLLQALRDNEGAAASLGNTFDSQMTRMKTAFQGLADALADTGLLDALSFVIEKVGQAIDGLVLGVLGLRLVINKLTFDSEESAVVMEGFLDKLDEINGVSAVATDKLAELAGDGSGNSGFSKVTKEAKAAAKAQEDVNKKLKEIYKDQEREASTIGFSNDKKEVREFQFAIEDLAESVGGFNAQQQAMADLLIENKEYIIKKKEAVEALAQSLLDARKASKESFDQFRKDSQEAADALAEPYKNAMREVQSTISGAFEGVFDGTIDTAQEAANSIKKIFIKLAAETATIQLLNLSGLNSVFSSSGSLSSSNSSSSGASGVGSLLQNGTGLLESTGIGTAINSFGASALPSLFGVAAGPTATGAAGYGTGLLSSAGLSLSSIALPVAGLAIGAIASSLFKSKPKSIASNFGGTISGSGEFENFVLKTNGKGDPETAKAISSGVSDAVKALANIGVVTGKTIVQGGVDAGKGFLGTGNVDYLSLRNGGSGAINFDPNKDGSLSEALGKLSLKLAMTSESTKGLEEKLAKVVTTGRKAEEVIADIDFIKNFKISLEDAKPVLGEVELSIKAINDNYDTTRKTLERLSGTLEDVNKLEEKRQKDLEKYKGSVFEDSVKGFIGSVAPFVNQLAELKSNYESKIKDFNASGINTTFVTKQYEVEREKLLLNLNKDRIDSLKQESDAIQKVIEDSFKLAEDYSNLSDSLTKTIFNLRTGDLSPLSKEDKLNQAKSLFNITASKAALGDINAGNQLDALSNEFLSLSKDFNASGERFVEDFNSVEQALNRAKETADRQVSIQQQIANSAREQVVILEKVYSALSNSVSGSNLQEQANQLNNSNPLPGLTKEQLLSAFPGTANSIYAKNQSAIQASGLEQTFLGLLDSYTRGTKGGSGRQALFLQNNPSVNQDLIQVARQLGIPGFNSGGAMFSNQVALVGEKRPEILQAGSNGGKIIPLENGQNLEQRLDSVEKEIKATNNILQYAFKKMIEKSSEQIQAIEDNTKAVIRSK